MTCRTNLKESLFLLASMVGERLGFFWRTGGGPWTERLSMLLLIPPTTRPCSGAATSSRLLLRTAARLAVDLDEGESTLPSRGAEKLNTSLDFCKRVRGRTNKNNNATAN